MTQFADQPTLFCKAPTSMTSFAHCLLLFTISLLLFYHHVAAVCTPCFVEHPINTKYANADIVLSGEVSKVATYKQQTLVTLKYVQYCKTKRRTYSTASFRFLSPYAKNDATCKQFAVGDVTGALFLKHTQHWIIVIT